MKKRNLGNRKGQRIRQAVGTSMLGVSLVLTSGVTVLAEEAVADSENVVAEAVVEDAEKAVAMEAEVALAEDYTGWDTLKVFETTDVHGYITDVSTYKDETFQYRLAYISNVVNQARANTAYDDVILVDGGDIYQSTPHSNLTYGNYLRAAFDTMKYDAVALGNHEFDWDVTKYAADSSGTMASYETKDTGKVNPAILVVASNLYYAGTDTRVNFTQDYTVVEKAGYTVAIVGWADEYSADIKASQIAPYKIDGDLEKLKEKTKKVKEDEDADVVIVLAHASPKEIAEAVDPEVVDLVCGGHSHKSSTGTASNGVDYIQGNCKAQGYGTADIKINPDTKEVDVVDPNFTYITSKTNNEHLYYKDGTNTQLDEKIVKISQEAWDAVKGEMYEVLATADQSITKDVVEGSIVTSTAGTWLTGLMLDATKDLNTVAAFANSGGIRTNLVMEEGQTTRDITVADIYTISPFGNRLLTYAITGKQMATQIENAIKFDDNDKVIYNYTNFGDQFAGITVTYEKQDKSIKVLSIVTDAGEIIDVNDETKTYNVVVNEYCATLSQEGIDSVFKNLTPLVALDEASVDNLSAIEALRARRDSEGLAMKVDTTAHLKEDAGEAEVCEQMTGLLNKADKFNADNVKPENKAELEQLNKDIDALIAGGKLTEGQITVLQSKKQEIDTLLNKLKEMEAESKKEDPKKEEPKKEEPKKETPKADPVKKTDNEKKAAKTGDENSLMLWILMMGTAGVGITASATKMKCRNK